VLKRVNLTDAHKKLPSEISGGMQKGLPLHVPLRINQNIVL
jgi:ABC-type nitrate/sulfonate/bicarbonate transport system ATPase subunit